jgi:outer membrane protein insertion porin family
MEQPYIFNKLIYGNFETYFQSIVIDPIQGIIYGSKVMLDFELPHYTFINHLKPYSNYEKSEIDLFAVPFEYNLETYYLDLMIEVLTATLGVELGSSKTNDLFFPSKGYNSLLILETSSATSDIYINVFQRRSGPNADSTIFGTGYHYKASLTNSLFQPLNRQKDFVAGLKLKTGYIQPFSGGLELVPASKTFFVGGSNSIRGWKAREIKAASSLETISAVDDTIRGGTFLIEGSLEFRKKLYDVFGTAIFIDYGNTWNGYSNFRWDELAVAAGFGFRYYSPIAPFRIDFGFKFYDPYDKQFIFGKNIWDNFAFHFGIGEAF